MNRVFADTSFYVALANPKDNLHDVALHASEQWSDTVITSEYMLLELGNYLRNMHDRTVFCDLLQALQSDNETQVVPASTPLFEKGVRMYSSRLDKEWSLPTAFPLLS